MRFLIIFIFLLFNCFASNAMEIKNLIIHKEVKKYNSISILDTNNKQIDLNEFKGNLILLNFWASWCAPCKEEMPSLDSLQSNMKLDNLKIIPINVGKDSIKKSLAFFKELKIKNLDLYFDTPVTLAKKFNLRGIPTTILIDKNGSEFARLVGSINFEDKKFINWLRKYN